MDRRLFRRDQILVWFIEKDHQAYLHHTFIHPFPDILVGILAGFVGNYISRLFLIKNVMRTFTLPDSDDQHFIDQINEISLSCSF
jgi:hypothetical protein